MDLVPGMWDPEEIMLWEPVHPRKIGDEDWQRFEGYVAEIFQALGMDLGTPGTRETPRRFLRAMVDSTMGYEGDHKLLTAFPTECRGGPDCRISQIIEGPISFFALCEHHALPFHGVAHVGYIAHERITGISKLTLWCDYSPDVLPCRSASGRKWPTTWWSSCGRTGWRYTSRAPTCVPKCEGFGRSGPARGPRSGGGPTKRTRVFETSSSGL